MNASFMRRFLYIMSGGTIGIVCVTVFDDTVSLGRLVTFVVVGACLVTAVSHGRR